MKRRSNRVVAGLLALLMVITMLPATVFAAEEVRVISSAAELLTFAGDVNGGDTYAGKTVQLAEDINLGGEASPWTPIGTFGGTFDGAGHVISGLYINATTDHQGLFGCVAEGGTVKNLVVQGSITTTKGDAAGIAGENKGTILNCSSGVDVTFTGSFVYYHAGIAGENTGTISDCVNSGTITAGTASGGIAGRNSGTVTDCYNKGEIKSAGGSHVGGIVGQSLSVGSSTPSVANCYNIGSVNGGANTGAIIGQQRDGACTNGYYLTDTAPYGIGSASDATGVKTEAELKAPAMLATLGDAYMADEDGINSGYPVLTWQKVVPDVIIGTCEQFLAFAEAVNGGNSYAGKRIKLDVNIDLGGKNNPWTPIGSTSAPFEGIFDGEYHVISGLYIASGSNVGLFGNVKGGTVKNLVVDGSVTGSSNVSGIVGYLDNGNIQSCGNRATVTGGSNVGGVVGSVNNTCKIESCFNTGSITATTGYIGGVTGQHWRAGVVENCYNVGAVTGPATVGGVTGGHQASSPTLTNCYNAGVVIDSAGNGNYVCAVLGRARSQTITNCFYMKNDGAVDEKEGITEVEALLASQLSSAFADGDVYPVLTWEEKIDTAEPVLPGFVESTERSKELADLIRAAVNSAKIHNGVGSGTLLGNDKFKGGASSTGTDWMALGMGRFGYYDVHGEYRHLIDDGSGYADYLDAMKVYIEKTYAEQNGILNSAKVTEWHRAVLAIMALGGDSTHFGTYNGKSINLIADGSYNCVISGGPGKQGINGWIFGLIAMDTGMFEVSEDAPYSREDFITEILKLQLSDGVGGNTYGGWVLSGAYGAKSDIDITAMAIQALAPYYNDSTVYTYTNTGSKEQRSVTVRQCVDEALDVLSSRMDRSGGFSSWGSKNVEGISQVLVALCSLGIDPATDARFIASSGKTLLDGLMQFRLPDGGFCHILGSEWNSMANDQATYALVSYWRLENGMRALYDMRGNFTEEQRSAIDDAVAAIDGLPEPASPEFKTKIKDALKAFRAVPHSEQRYVRNYTALATALDMIGGEKELDTDTPFIVGIEVTKQPDKQNYLEGECFNPAGMILTAKYHNGDTKVVADYTYAPTGALEPTDTEIVIRCGLFYTRVSITVAEKMPWQGEGTKEAPYRIDSDQALAALAEKVNGGKNFEGQFFVMTADMDLSDLLWTPIGLSEKLAFAGTFDGQGFCIDNLYSSLGGLFGYAADSAVIRNVGVASGEIGREAGYSSFFGGILGWSDGADVINCWNGADITCGSYSGGVVGTVRGGESVISGCFNRGWVTGPESSTHLGGIVGHLDPGHPVTVEDCYNLGDIVGGYSVGGIVGALQDGPHTITRCYNAGTVQTITVNPSMSGRAGAIVGDSTSKNTVKDCYYLDGSCEEGGINKAAGIRDTTVPLSDAQMKDGTLLAALGDAFQADPYALVNGGYPLLIWQKTEEADAVDEVISLIDAIGEVTMNREDAIRAAREAYDALDDETLWALVTNYETLTEAEKKLQALKDAAEPSDPEDPSNPSEPSKPTDPSDPSKPDDPSDPTDPGASSPSSPSDPSGSGDSSSPQTGDTTPLPFYLFLMLVSGLAVIVLGVSGKRQKKR